MTANSNLRMNGYQQFKGLVTSLISFEHNDIAKNDQLQCISWTSVHCFQIIALDKLFCRELYTSANCGSCLAGQPSVVGLESFVCSKGPGGLTKIFLSFVD